MTHADKLQAALQPVFAAAKARGVLPQTVVQGITKDPRRLDSMMRKAKSLDEDTARIVGALSARATGE